MNDLFDELRGYIGNENLVVQVENDEVKIVCADDNATLITSNLDWEKTKFLWHQGHDIHCACYGKDDVILNISIECMDCNDVLFDMDNLLCEGDD